MAVTENTPTQKTTAQGSPVSPSATETADDDRMGAVYAAARWVLMIGFSVVAALLAIGLIVAIVRSQSLSEETIPLGDLPNAVLDGEAAAFIDLAILAVIATPVITSLVVAVAFARIGDRIYTLISLAVFAILCVSLILPTL